MSWKGIQASLLRSEAALALGGQGADHLPGQVQGRHRQAQLGRGFPTPGGRRRRVPPDIAPIHGLLQPVHGIRPGELLQHRLLVHADHLQAHDRGMARPGHGLQGPGLDPVVAGHRVPLAEQHVVP
jgi:hypothetical protein